MSLAELLPAIRALPKSEQVELLHLLIDGVAEAPPATAVADDGITEEMRKYLAPPGYVFDYWGPITTDAAGFAAIEKALADFKESRWVRPLVSPFLPRGTGNGPLDLVPLLPARLSRNGVDVDVVGLVDSGASFSVLPYDTGARFGLDWNSLPNGLILSGAAGGIPAKLIALDLTFGPFSPVTQLFAWADRNGPPVVFGQITFFLNFDVFFARARSFFEIQPATAPTP